ncbi:MAG TPA: tRNA glutamyl-Q(34) synthetase GluQRS [Terracidiphilus sp.]|nr:tRNA glutamyl-Q(34) synthetase GluQRS [Terracidiphilus sp.]
MASLAPTPTSSYRGRLAPSPTGYLHVGHARTFFAAWQRARDAGGALVMRMEDLDPDRSKQVYAEAAYEDLRWLGIRWQEGPDKGGPFAPYVQSRRRSIYLAAWRRLLRRGYLYPCRCSRKDLESALGAPHERVFPATQGSVGGGKWDLQDDEPIYPGTCRHLLGRAPQLPGPTASDIDTPEGFNWRFRVPDGEAIEFVDRNLGKQRFVAGVDFGDFVVWRRDGVPSYQLACVADDAAMGITEVVRGADLLKSTARQILLNRALGYSDPAWFHCRLVVDHNGRRLAKRHDSLSLRALRQRGLTPMNILSAELPVEV